MNALVRLVTKNSKTYCYQNLTHAEAVEMPGSINVIYSGNDYRIA